MYDTGFSQALGLQPGIGKCQKFLKAKYGLHMKMLGIAFQILQGK
jgi:hypothetical protein